MVRERQALTNIYRLRKGNIILTSYMEIILGRVRDLRANSSKFCGSSKETGEGVYVGWALKWSVLIGVRSVILSTYEEKKVSKLSTIFESPASMFPDINDWQQRWPNLRVEMYARPSRHPIMFDGWVRPSSDLNQNMDELTIKISRDVRYRRKESKRIFTKFYVLQFKIFTQGSD